MSNKLGAREKEVLLLSFLSIKETAEKMKIKPSTVVSHRMNIMCKLGADSLVGAVITALKKGIVKLEEFKNDIEY